jgi:hypothetical protein
MIMKAHTHRSRGSSVVAFGAVKCRTLAKVVRLYCQIRCFNCKEEAPFAGRMSCEFHAQIADTEGEFQCCVTGF